MSEAGFSFLEERKTCAKRGGCAALDFEKYENVLKLCENLPELGENLLELRENPSKLRENLPDLGENP